MKHHEASITFHQETWHQACLVFMLLTLKKAKNLFSALRYLSKNFIYYIALERLHIVTHSYTASFSIKMKLITFFISKTKQIYAKTLTVPKNTFKIKAILP